MNEEVTWERYVSTWKPMADAERHAHFESCLDTECEYTDPLAKLRGWEELGAYMRDFQKRFPGGHFVTSYFLAHNQRSIAKWDMCDAAGVSVSNGVSYGEYNESGKLVAMTGLFEVPAP